MVEVEEIREMDGKRYIGRFQLADDGVTEEHSVYDTVSGALELRQLRWWPEMIFGGLLFSDPQASSQLFWSDLYWAGGIGEEIFAERSRPVPSL